MTESQSRYGIMEELNTKKLAEKTALAKLESDKELLEQQKQELIASLEAQITATEGTYEMNHKQWVARQMSGIRIKTAEFNREVERLQDEVKAKEENYKPDFNAWKAGQKRQIDLLRKELADYTKQQGKAIESKQEILEEIDAGITNLKEMSKEQKEK